MGIGFVFMITYFRNICNTQLFLDNETLLCYNLFVGLGLTN